MYQPTCSLSVRKVVDHAFSSPSYTVTPTTLDPQSGEKLRVSREDVRRLTAKLEKLEAERAALERQAENDADATADRVRAAGKRITELQGESAVTMWLLSGKAVALKKIDVGVFITLGVACGSRGCR